MINEYFKLYSNCFLVKGIKNSLIVDVHNVRYLPIGPALYDFLSGPIKAHTLADLLEDDNYDKKGIEEYLNYLISNDFGFMTTDPGLFPPIDLTYHSPNKLEYAIIIIDSIDLLNYNVLIAQLIDLGVVNFQFIITKNIKRNESERLKDFLKGFINTKANSIELVFEKETFNIKTFRELLVVTQLTIKVFGAKQKKTEFTKGFNKKVKSIQLLKKKLNINKKAKYDPNKFQILIKYFVEAQQHNVGLNKKIFIGAKGEVKNYINHTKIYGNLVSDNLEDIIESKEFRKKWFIHNSLIEKCKDCQFKFICGSTSDIEIREDKFYKMEDCNFNPYTNTWE